MKFSFECTSSDGAARTGVITTAHGTIETPVFMPVGTAATVKGVMPEQVAHAGSQIILANTYHLMLRPGAVLVEKLGGLHSFMNWQKPILTDSGGFQVMSLKELASITEEGVTFKSHIDGSSHMLTPESAMHIQKQLNSTITMVLDECTSYPVEKDEAEASMLRSMRWAKRCREAFTKREGYGLFGIVQGGMYDDLRLTSVDMLQNTGFDGYAIGGLAVGEGQEVMFSVLDKLMPHMPGHSPRYLMGVGKPDDLLGAVMRGVDMFDCVIPTRSGRFARAYTFAGEVNIRNAAHATNAAPLEEGCPCPACSHYSRSYLHHLFRCDEMLGPMLLSLHNITFYQRHMKNMRDAIREKRLQHYASTFLASYQSKQ